MGVQHYFNYSPKAIGKSRTKMYIGIIFILVILTMFGVIVAASAGAFNKPNQQKSTQKTAQNTSSQSSSKNTNIQFVKIENHPRNDNKRETQEPMAEQVWSQKNKEELCSKDKLNYATFILTIIFGICLFLELLAALFFLIKAGRKERK